MTLNSFYFVAFLMVVLVIEWLLSGLKNQSLKSHAVKISLIIFSFIFMLAADWRYALCLFGYALFVFLIACKIDVSGSAWWITAGIAGSLGLLGYFKYTNFILQNFNRIFDIDIPLLSLLLPIGISFFTLASPDPSS